MFKILNFKIVDMNNINSNCKTYRSHFLEYVLASIFVGGSSTSRGKSREAQQVVACSLRVPGFHPALLFAPRLCLRHNLWFIVLKELERKQGFNIIVAKVMFFGF